MSWIARFLHLSQAPFHRGYDIVGEGGASRASIVAQAVNSRIEVIGVQAEKAPWVYLSSKERFKVAKEKAETFAEGLQVHAQPQGSQQL